MAHILNCLVDDAKFINEVVKILEFLRGEHTIHHVYISEKGKFDTSVTCQDQITFLKPDEVLPFIRKHDIVGVIMHNISSMPMEIVLQLPKHVKLLWKAWGFDLYQAPAQRSPFIPLSLYRPLTQDFRKNDKNMMRGIRNEWLVYQLFRRRRVHRMMKRVDFFSGVYPEEYDLLCKQHHSYFRASHLFYPYFGWQGSYINMSSATVGDDIVVGKSAGQLNQHLDVLHQLKDIIHHNQRIVMPFSYQHYEPYCDKVKRCVQEWLPEQVIFLEKFVKYEEYFQLLASCSYAIYGNEHQGGVGNINRSIYDGKKVFLSKTSLNYEHYCNLGIKVYSIQDDLTADALRTPLSKEEKAFNRQRLLETDNNLEKNKAFISKILETLTKE